VVGGAAGNVCDRLFRGEAWFRGAVVDFIDLQWWPVFNIADIGVTVGGILLVVASIWGRPRRVES
jgi:signal peptidase II